MTVLPAVEQLVSAVAPGTPLERLTAANELTVSLRIRGDELLDQFVDAARTAGCSWNEIGCALGTSKQAAQQRFAALADPPPGAAPFGLTGTAAEALNVAAEEARQLGHHYIRPEHLVLGLLSQPEELAARALAELGVTADTARERVTERLGRAEPRPTGSLGLAPQTKRLLELARVIAKTLGHRCARTEHILLAAISPKLHSPAATLLAESDASLERVQDQVTRMLLQEAPELAVCLRNRSLLHRARMRSA